MEFMSSISDRFCHKASSWYLPIKIIKCVNELNTIVRKNQQQAA
jgi:hypothetical protein